MLASIGRNDAMFCVNVDNCCSPRRGAAPWRHTRVCLPEFDHKKGLFNSCYRFEFKMNVPTLSNLMEKIMRIVKESFALLLCLCLLALGNVAAAADRRCNVSTLVGPYGFTESGLIVGFGSYAAVGTLTSDGKGNFIGAFTESLNGAIGVATLTGSYQVAPDCTGTAILRDSFGRTGNRAFVILADAAEINYLFTDPGFVATGVAKKQEQRGK